MEESLVSQIHIDRTIPINTAWNERLYRCQHRFGHQVAFDFVDFHIGNLVINVFERGLILLFIEKIG